MTEPLTVEQEAQAQDLARILQEESFETFLAISRDLIAASDQNLFGKTEIRIRDRLLALGACAYQKVLEEKKTATRGAPSTVKPAGQPLPSTTTDPGPR